MEQNKRLLKQFHAICNKLGMTTEDRKRFVAELGHQSSSEMSDLELSHSISELTSIYVANNRRLNIWRRRVMAVIFEHFRLQNKEVSKEYVIAVATRQTKNKDGRFNVMVKLFTMEDRRFDYRKEVVASSIRPVNAALLVQLAKDYMIEDARVLDPFCGVGTMLIERQKKIVADTSYRLHIYE